MNRVPLRRSFTRTNNEQIPLALKNAITVSSLSSNDKLKLEKLFEMSGGYVLDFSDRTLREFVIENTGKDIDDNKYLQDGTSKAKRFRIFWNIESDATIGKLLFAMFDRIETSNLLNHVPESADQKLLVSACRKIAERLTGRKPQESPEEMTESDFIQKEFSNVSFDRINLPGEVITVLEQRATEIKSCLSVKSWLAVVFLCGSALEGILLGIASGRPVDFNNAKSSPKDKTGKVFPIPDWKLANFIDVSCELGVLDENVKKFSHALRDFRNYIHPFKQVNSGFSPNEHTAKICWQVLKAVIEQVSKPKP